MMPDELNQTDRVTEHHADHESGLASECGSNDIKREMRAVLNNHVTAGVGDDASVTLFYDLLIARGETELRAALRTVAWAAGLIAGMAR